MSYSVLAQRDPRWSTKSIGYTSTTLGTDGCLFMCLLMMVTRGREFLPIYIDTFMSCLKGHGNYIPGDAKLQLWDVSKCVPTEWGSVKFLRASSRYTGPTPQKEIDALLAHLAAGHPALIEVDSKLATKTLDQHFVLATGLNAGGGIVINDPWFGDQTLLWPRYGSSNAGAVWRFVLYETIAPQDDGDPIYTPYRARITARSFNLAAAVPLGTIVSATDTGVDYMLKLADGRFVFQHEFEPYTSPAPVRNPVFTATPTSITAGQSSVLAWSNTDGANKLMLDGAGVTGPSGSKSVSPTATATYKLVVSYPDGQSIERGASVTVSPAPQPPATPPRIGLNVLFDAAAGRQAFADGCRFFLVMDNTDLANELASNGATVMYRQYFNHVPSAQECAEMVGTRVGHPSIIRTGINENEGINGNDIAWHAAFDADVATRLRAMNPAYRYAGGTYSMGTPDYLDTPQVRADMRKYYAPIYNSGLIWWDQHSYSNVITEIDNPNVGVKVIDGVSYPFAVSDWLSTRWRWLFRICGFDPTVRHIVSGECGVDEGGVGGFTAHDYSGQQVVDYMKTWKVKQAEPITIEGKSYPSPFVGGAIFQAGDAGDKWRSFDMRGYFQIIRDNQAWS